MIVRRLLKAVLVCSLSHWFITAHADVKCKCNRVEAVGEGNSSCTTAESGGKCTIDFNQFAVQAQDRAGATLTRIAGRFGGSNFSGLVPRQRDEAATCEPQVIDAKTPEVILRLRAAAPLEEKVYPGGPWNPKADGSYEPWQLVRGKNRFVFYCKAK